MDSWIYPEVIWLNRPKTVCFLTDILTSRQNLKKRFVVFFEVLNYSSWVENFTKQLLFKTSLVFSCLDVHILTYFVFEKLFGAKSLFVCSLPFSVLFLLLLWKRRLRLALHRKIYIFFFRVKCAFLLFFFTVDFLISLIEQARALFSFLFFLNLVILNC